MKKYLLGFLLLTAVTLCGCQTLQSLGVSTGRSLITEDGRYLLICDDTPIVMSNRSKDSELFNGLNSGDVIRVVHDGIAESYPAQTGAYRIRKLSDGSIEDIPVSVLDTLMDLGWKFSGIERVDPLYSVCPFPTAVSWANYGDESLLWTRALNRDQAVISSIQHLPVLRFDSAAELAMFKTAVSGTFETQLNWNEIPSFDTVTANMDEVFFASNSILLVHVRSASCTWRYGVSRVDVEKNALTVHVQRTDSFEAGDCAMAGWFITLTVPKETISGITMFDAALDTPTE